MSSSYVSDSPLSFIPSLSPPRPSSVPDISLSTSSVPSSSLLVNTYPMVTRSKLGIHKPKVLKVIANYTYQEPPSFVVVIKHPQWKAAMDSKFNSLLKQQT